jgi:DNA-binding NarL/FixJ family response regulator
VGCCSSRVLVVEDYEPFRRFLSSALQKAPGLQIVGEVSDGLEAVRQAERLQPDLILVDIGLPAPEALARAWRNGLGIRAECLNRLVVTLVRLEDRR